MEVGALPPGSAASGAGSATGPLRAAPSPGTEAPLIRSCVHSLTQHMGTVWVLGSQLQGPPQGGALAVIGGEHQTSEQNVETLACRAGDQAGAPAPPGDVLNRFQFYSSPGRVPLGTPVLRRVALRNKGAQQAGARAGTGTQGPCSARRRAEVPRAAAKGSARGALSRGAAGQGAVQQEEACARSSSDGSGTEVSPMGGEVERPGAGAGVGAAPMAGGRG